MKLSKLKKNGSIPLSKVAPYDFEDGDTNNFKDMKAFPKKPYTLEQVQKAMFALHKMIERQAENYGKGKLFKAGVVKESGDEHEDEHSELVQKCYDLLKHLQETDDEDGLQMFMGIVSGIIDIPHEVTESEEEDNEPRVIPKAKAYGGILMHGGSILLREVANHFDGYGWTYAKGKVDAGETPEETALREVREETGYNAEITHFIPKVFTSYQGSTTAFYIMKPVNKIKDFHLETHQANTDKQFHWETEQVKWVTRAEAEELIKQHTTNRQGLRRDLEILEAAFSGEHVPVAKKVEESLQEALNDDQKAKYARWKKLINMSPSELTNFKASQMEKGSRSASKYPGLKPKEARQQGISSGVQSANWIIKMKKTPVQQWTPEMWRWCGKQISFVSRMSGAAGPLHDENGQPTRKLLSLKIWGHNPSKKS
jgi:8-oxo-dGTP diphosphatase